ncbi:hypothetical protein DFJ73DRAFT_810424 [Zopfochytrium polystomum]|nr:hypothetical protein DFJ73DRAFT_810424 [Zopfochytrium polystomum]
MSESRSTQTARPRQVAFTTPSFPDAGIDADDEDSHSDFSGSPAASRSSTGLASGSSATTRTRIPPSSRTVGLSPSRNGRGSVASQSDGPEGASQSGRSASLVESTALVLWHVWHGLTDAFAWPASLITIYGSKTIQVASFKCLFLNFGVFIGSWLLYRYAVSPLFHLVVSPVPIGDSVPLGKLSETDTATAAADGVANWFRSLLRHLRPSYYVSGCFLLTFSMNISSHN